MTKESIRYWYRMAWKKHNHKIAVSNVYNARKKKTKGIFRSALHNFNKIKSYYQNIFLEMIFEFFHLQSQLLKHSFKMTVSRRNGLTTLQKTANRTSITPKTIRISTCKRVLAISQTLCDRAGKNPSVIQGSGIESTPTSAKVRPKVLRSHLGTWNRQIFFLE